MQETVTGFLNILTFLLLLDDAIVLCNIWGNILAYYALQLC